MDDLLERVKAEQERSLNDPMFSWTHTPEGIEYLRKAIAKGIASGRGRELNREEFLAEARIRLKKAKEKIS